MSLAEWYYYKADQCARMAKDAIESHKRANYEEEQRLWLQLVEQIKSDEKANGSDDQSSKGEF